MKRFTETEKWRDPWFQKLDRESRTLWIWLCDRVDHAGVIDICWPICNAETLGEFSENSMLAFGDKVERISNGKWWIPGFILFQVGELSQSCLPHAYIIKLLCKHNLRDRVAYRVCNTLKDKDKEREGSVRETKYPASVLEVFEAGNLIGAPREVCQRFWDHYEGNGWLLGSGFKVQKWKSKLSEWKAANEEKQQKEKMRFNGNGVRSGTNIRLRATTEEEHAKGF